MTMPTPPAALPGPYALAFQYGDALDAAASGPMPSGSKISESALIYLGKSHFVGPTGGRAQDGVLTYGQAKMLPAQWAQSDPAKLKQFVNTGILRKMPGFDVNMGMPEIMSAWDDLVKSSYSLSQGSDTKWSPQDVMDTYADKNRFGTVRQGDWIYDVATKERVKYVGPRTKTQTDRSINLSSAEDVKALTTQVLTQALGRAPTDKELAQYKSTINAQEQATPSVTTQVQHIGATGEVASADTTTTGGVSAAAQQQMIQEAAQKTPEYAKYQAGTTYYNAMMSLLAGG